MSIESGGFKPPEEKKKEEEPIKGDNFVMGGKGYYPRGGSSAPPVEFRPGESTETAQKERDEEMKKELERTKDFTNADHAEDMLSSMLRTNNPYSETFRIKPDGTFDKISRIDGKPVYLGYGDTPAGLYQIAQEIEKKHPEYKFVFETDPEGKWMKYTVSKSESGK